MSILEEFLCKIMGQNKTQINQDRPKKVIIDCDPGSDDGQAILLAIHLAKKHNVEIIGITTVAGNANIDHVSMNAQLVLQVCKEPEIPVFKGCDKSLTGHTYEDPYYGPDGFGGYLLESLSKSEFQHTNIKEQSAIQFLSESAEKLPNEITLICLAPLTNIATAVQTDPKFAKNIKNLFILGGTYLSIGNTNNLCSEFNFLKDPEAAQIVFESFDDITLIPVEVPQFSLIHPESLTIKAFTAQTEKGKLVFESFKIAYAKSGFYGIIDPIAVAVAFEPQIVTQFLEKKCFIETKGEFTKGMVVIDWKHRHLPSKERSKVKIVSAIDNEMMVQLLIDAVAD